MQPLLANYIEVPKSHDWTVNLGNWTFGIEEEHLGVLFDDPVQAESIERLCPPTAVHLGRLHFRTHLPAPVTAVFGGAVLIIVVAVAGLVVARLSRSRSPS